MDRGCFPATAAKSIFLERGREMQWSKTERDAEAQRLPPGFRFYPTDEELVLFYLARKIENPNFSNQTISEADLNKCEPWELPGKAKIGEKEWYFYSLKDRKYPTGVRTNRATQAGYWKATGKDREVIGTGGGHAGNGNTIKALKGKLLGMKKTLVFYKGRAPKGTKSNWVMHEYRAEDPLKHSLKLQSSKDEWVLCRVFHKNGSGKKMALEDLELAPAHSGNSNYQPQGLDARLVKLATTLPALTEVPWDQAPGPCSYASGQTSNDPAPSFNVPSQGSPYLGGGGHQVLPCLAGGQQFLNAAFGGAAAAGCVSMQQVNALRPEPRDQFYLPFLQDDGQLQVAPAGGNLQVPVTSWAGVEGSFCRTSPDSFGSSLEFTPSPYLAAMTQHHVIPRLPSDLESLFAL